MVEDGRLQRKSWKRTYEFQELGGNKRGLPDITRKTGWRVLWGVSAPEPGNIFCAPDGGVGVARCEGVMIRADWWDLSRPVTKMARGMSQPNLARMNQDAKHPLAISQLSCEIMGRTRVGAVHSHHSRMRTSNRSQLTHRIIKWFVTHFSLWTEFNGHCVFSNSLLFWVKKSILGRDKMENTCN